MMVGFLSEISQANACELRGPTRKTLRCANAMASCSDWSTGISSRLAARKAIMSRGEEYIWSVPSQTRLHITDAGRQALSGIQSKKSPGAVPEAFPGDYHEKT